MKIKLHHYFIASKQNYNGKIVKRGLSIMLINSIPCKDYLIAWEEKQFRQRKLVKINLKKNNYIVVNLERNRYDPFYVFSVSILITKTLIRKST